jgi:D-amino-acid dehydrogenase
MVDTIVLGAGAVGVATAYYLARNGEQVTVIERQPAAALETSWGNGGVIHACEVEPWSQPGMPLNIVRWIGNESAPLLLRASAIPHMWRWGLQFALNCSETRFRRNCEANLALALYSLRSLQEIRAETGMVYDAATKGVMKIYRSAGALDKAERSLRRMEPLGLTFQRLTAAEAVQAEPALGDSAGELAGAFHFPHDEVGDCNKFTQALADECARLGVRFLYGTEVRGIDVEGGRASGVVTVGGRLAASRVVVALGSFTPGMVRALGLDIPIYPVKGVSITFPRSIWNGAPAMPVIDDSHLFGIVPIGDRIRISGSAEITGFDTAPSEDRCQTIVRNAMKTFPSLAGCFDRAAAIFWAGLRPVTPTGSPIIGPTRLPGLWLNAGHGHLGWTLACGSGRVLAELTEGRDRDWVSWLEHSRSADDGMSIGAKAY